jgi:hypothetical protein
MQQVRGRKSNSKSKINLETNFNDFNHIYKIIILPTLVIRIPNLEIFLFCQHKSTGGGNLELRQTIPLFSFIV